MDIAKIRKKALSKGAEEKAGEKPREKTPAPAEDKKEQGTVEESSAPVEGIRGVGTAGKDEDQAGILVADDLSDEHTVEMVELLTFSISREEYAFRVPEVEEVLRMQKIARVPTMPEYVLGITSLRGKIIPVIDLQTRLNLQGKSLSAGSSGDPETETKRWQEKKILIIDGPKGLIGATIDKVMGVVRLPLSEMLQPPGHLDENELRFIEGIVVLKKRFISVIHSDAAMDIEVS